MNTHITVAADTGDTACTNYIDQCMQLDALEVLDSELPFSHPFKDGHDTYDNSPRSYIDDKVHSVLLRADASTQTDLSFLTHMKTTLQGMVTTQAPKRRLPPPIRSGRELSGIRQPSKRKCATLEQSLLFMSETTSNKFDVINAMLARHTDARRECVDGLPRNLL